MRPTSAPLLLAALCWLGCGSDDKGSDALDSGAGGDTATDSGAGDSGGDTGSDVSDADGDGYPRWDLATDPALADCDDTDASVTPATERLIPAGPFLRGDDAGHDTMPVREITLDAYCLDVTELTLAVAAEVLSTSTEEDRWDWYDFDDDDDHFDARLVRDEDDVVTVVDGYADHPVTEITIEGAHGFCGALGKEVPTEARWEKGARGGCEFGSDPDACDDGDQRQYPWGDDEPTCETANHINWETGECVGDSMPVTTYPENVSPYGLLNTAGNVSEWVSDWYQEGYYTESDTHEPQGPDSGFATDELNPDGFEARVQRGGNYFLFNLQIGVAYRMPDVSWATSNGVGVRCSRAL